MPVVGVAAPAVVLAANPFSQWFERHGDALVSVPLRITLIAALAVALRLVAARLITRAVRRLVSTEGPRRHDGHPPDTRTAKDERIARGRREQRAQTIASVLRSTT